jgi:hypothetical protein
MKGKSEWEEGNPDRKIDGFCRKLSVLGFVDLFHFLIE